MRGLDTSLFVEITNQFKAKAIRVKTGTLVDASIIASASEDDGDARWVKHKGKPAVHGFKAHVGASRPGTSRSIVCEAGSRKSSGHGNVATVSDACGGSALPGLSPGSA